LEHAEHALITEPYPFCPRYLVLLPGRMAAVGAEGEDLPVIVDGKELLAKYWEHAPALKMVNLSQLVFQLDQHLGGKK
jgi:hypothetical protein